MKKITASLLGLINKENKVLISKRKKSVNYKDFWEFPGGKVEKSESSVDALIRETYEELDLFIDASCVSPLTFSIDKTVDQEILLLLFVCRKWKGEPKNREGQEIKWARPLDLYKYKMPPANIFLNSILRDWI